MDVYTGRATAPTPKYWKVRDAVEQMIRANGLRPGDRLPTESEFGERFLVSRGTVRRAFDDLEREGVVSRESGRGTFVAERRLLRPLSELTSFTEHLVSLGLEPGARLISYRQASDDDGGDHFREGTPLARIVRVRTADGEPVGIHTLYVPVELARSIGFTTEVLRRTPELSLYGALASAGVEIEVAREDLTARLARSRELELLCLEPYAPVLEVVRRTFDRAGRAVELVRAVYRADRYDYVIWLRRDPSARGQEEEEVIWA
ncbi:MAG: GntR family transcriptional regulator [Gaiellaceae bacterium]|jgi:GntR family transcriptional regulator